MTQRILFPLFLAVLLCGILTACAGKALPELPPEVPPVELSAAVAETAPVTSYIPEGLGTKELFYNDHWKFYIQEHEPEPGHNNDFGAASLICRDLTTGNEWVLDELGYGSGHSYWHTVLLYPFTDILGCNGFIFEHGVGAAYEAYDFYAVNDTGALLIARCNNEMYTADLDGDGRPELLSNYHNAGYLDLFWTEGENDLVCTCSLNETARDYIGLIPGELVSLYLREGDGQLEARWAGTADGSSWKTRTLDLVSLWKWEKARKEFWDVLPLYTDDGRDISIRLRESRSRPDDYPLFRDYYRIDEVQVCDGDTLLQTISPDELTCDGDYLFEGLFVVHTFEKVPGIPDIRDFNFDGSEDLGLLAVDGFPHNVSYCYFLWDPEAGQLSTDYFVLFSPLDIDEENRRLIEPLAQTEDKRYYCFDASNQPVLINPA